MLTKDMFEGSPFKSFVVVEYSRFEEYDPETETMYKKFIITKIKEEDFGEYEYLGEGTQKGVPRVQRLLTT